MISYLGSLVQFSPATGRAGHCRQTSLCVDSTHRVPATRGLPRTGVSVLSPPTLLRFPAALYGAGPALSAVPVFEYSTKARIRLRLRFVPSLPEWFRQPEAWAHFPRMRHTFSLHGPSARRRSGLRKSLDRNQGLFAGWEGVASRGLSLPLSPTPAYYLQRGWAGSSLEFLSPFVLRTTGGVFQPVNFSLALPQFKKISLRLLSGPSGWSLP